MIDGLRLHNRAADGDTVLVQLFRRKDSAKEETKGEEAKEQAPAQKDQGDGKKAKFQKPDRPNQEKGKVVGIV